MPTQPEAPGFLDYFIQYAEIDMRLTEACGKLAAYGQAPFDAKQLQELGLSPFDTIADLALAASEYHDAVRDLTEKKQQLHSEFMERFPQRNATVRVIDKDKSAGVIDNWDQPAKKYTEVHGKIITESVLFNNSSFMMSVPLSFLKRLDRGGSPDMYQIRVLQAANTLLTPLVSVEWDDK